MDWTAFSAKRWTGESSSLSKKPLIVEPRLPAIYRRQSGNFPYVRNVYEMSTGELLPLALRRLRHKKLMSNPKLRQRIATEAARLMHQQQESDYYQAKMKAVKVLGLGEVASADLPTNAAVRQQIRQFADLEPTEPRPDNLQKMQAAAAQEKPLDVFQVYEALLLPLENVKQNLKYHPEGDALYHSLQVFDHARDELPYDEEFLVAALLHDVGKAIDPADHVTAGLEALANTITERTTWLIEHHMLTHAIADQTLGSRAHRRLRESEYYNDLVLLGECDRAGRQPGVEAPELEEAIEYLRGLSGTFG